MSEVSTATSPVSTNSKVRSRHSGRVTFPQSGKSTSSKSLAAAIRHNPYGNPFRVTAEQDIFMLRDKERLRKKEERERQRHLKVHEKMTYRTRANSKSAAMRRGVLELDEDEAVDEAVKSLSIKDEPKWMLTVTRVPNVEKEDIGDYVAKKRQKFLIQYSLSVKKEEMKKLEDLAAAEERKLKRAEKYLEDDATTFDEFLKENDRNSVQAIKVAEAETKAKLEKVAEIRKNSAMMMAMKSEISKHEETLKEYLLYKEFLKKLTPKEWNEAKEAARNERRKSKAKEQQAQQSASAERKSLVSPGKRRADSEPRSSSRGRDSSPHIKTRGILRGPSANRGPRTTSPTPKSNADSGSVKSAATSEDESDEEPELYFTDPKQLLVIFQELEEQNLSLITNSQETEEAMEELKRTVHLTKAKLNHETGILKSQINVLKGTIKRERQKADELELKTRMFSYGDFKTVDQEKMLKQLHKKVEEVYRSCVGDNEANISTLQMLTMIENRLEELFEKIDVMPADLVDAAEKAKEKERRLRLREEKLATQRAHQEERVRKALERAKAEPKKKGGKKLVFRSEPPQQKRKGGKEKDAKDKEEEEMLYYFT